MSKEKKDWLETHMFEKAIVDERFYTWKFDDINFSDHLNIFFITDVNIDNVRNCDLREIQKQSSDQILVYMIDVVSLNPFPQSISKRTNCTLSLKPIDFEKINSQMFLNEFRKYFNKKICKMFDRRH